MNAQDISRIVWLVLALSGIAMSVCTLRLALLDYLAANRLPRPNGRRLVARILVRDEILSLFVQVGFVAVAISAWIDPGVSPARNVVLAIVALVLGFNSICRYRDRTLYDSKRDVGPVGG